MTKRSRHAYSAAFGTKIALSASKGEETVAQLSTRYDVHSNQSTQWKTPLLEHAADVFAGAGASAEPGPDIKTLHAKIGQLALENDYLADALERSPGLNVKR